MSEPMNNLKSVSLPAVTNEYLDKGIWGGRSEKPVETIDPGVKLQPQIETAKQPNPVSGANQAQAVTATNPKEKPTPLAQTNVRLKFEVDSKTKEVKVLILDPASHKVIRTIPADELKNFREGGMVDLNT